MDTDFHYHCIRALGQCAGFPADEAQTIAFASQYSDDATEHKRMRIEGVPDDVGGKNQYREGWFDPTCTAHGASSWHKQLWKWAKFYLKEGVQRKVLLCFHFLPAEELQGNENFNFVTKANGPFARALLGQATSYLKKANTEDQRQFGLVALMVLHTYADTWAHEGFSGRHCPGENDVENVEVRKNGKWKGVGLFDSLVSYAAPDVGHSEVKNLPDRSDRIWRADYADSDNPLKRIERENPQLFLAAAEVIYEAMCGISPYPALAQPWDTIKEGLLPCFKKKATWPEVFEQVDFNYNRFTWREASLCGDSVDWDDFGKEEEFAKLRLRFTGKDKRWFMFHKAAYDQREFVLERIPLHL